MSAFIVLLAAAFLIAQTPEPPAPSPAASPAMPDASAPAMPAAPAPAATEPAMAAPSQAAPATSTHGGADSQKVQVRFVYRFGYNTKVEAQGTGTGMTTIDVKGPAGDGGEYVTGTDDWWHTARPRAQNTCEVYPNGSVTCGERPYAISPIQVTAFVMLARDIFKGLTSDGQGSWQLKYNIKAALLPGGSSNFANYQYTWSATSQLEGKGHAPDAHQYLLVQGTGTMNQQGGRHYTLNVKTGALYDPVAKLPVFVSQTRKVVPQSGINQDMVQLQLLKVTHNPKD